MPPRLLLEMPRAMGPDPTKREFSPFAQLQEPSIEFAAERVHVRDRAAVFGDLWGLGSSFAGSDVFVFLKKLFCCVSVWSREWRMVGFVRVKQGGDGMAV